MAHGLTRTGGVPAGAANGSRAGAKRDPSLVVPDQAVVGDRSAGELAGQVFHHSLRRCIRSHWGVTIRHPGGPLQRFQPPDEGFRIPRTRPFSVKLPFAAAVQTPQAFQEYRAERQTQGVGLHEPVLLLLTVARRTARFPPRAVQRGPAARHQSMHMSVRLLSESNTVDTLPRESRELREGRGAEEVLQNGWRKIPFAAHAAPRKCDPKAWPGLRPQSKP